MGRDDNDGLSLDAPFKSVDHALEIANPCDHIITEALGEMIKR